MVTYIVRRLFTAVLILLGASFLVYQLTALSGDPLHDLRESNSPNKEQLIQQRIGCTKTVDERLVSSQNAR
jgi:peptide/nickel transport system permease protein